MSNTEPVSGADLPDSENRLLVTTRTPNGQWDQVIAMSQTMINDGFKNLFQVHPELEIMYDTSPEIGTIDAVLHPPTVLIPGGNQAVASNKIYYQLR